jgi:hypothetical protein
MDEYIEVVEEDGVVRYSPSREDPRQAIIEYNTGLAIRELWSFGDRASAPAMAKPLTAHNPPRPHSLYFAVYWCYENRRTRGEEPLDLSGTGEEALADQLP